MQNIVSVLFSAEHLDLYVFKQARGITLEIRRMGSLHRVNRLRSFHFRKRNPAKLPVDVSGLILADGQAGSPDTHVLAPLSFIGPNGYLKLIADGNTSLGPGHLGFRLDAEQESISLYAANGALMDTLAYFPQTTDMSLVRSGTSTSGFAFRELPTGGFEMSATDPVYLNALAMIRGPA